jgi:hypothetical protein
MQGNNKRKKRIKIETQTTSENAKCTMGSPKRRNQIT